MTLSGLGAALGMVVPSQGVSLSAFAEVWDEPSGCFLTNTKPLLIPQRLEVPISGVTASNIYGGFNSEFSGSNSRHSDAMVQCKCFRDEFLDR